MKYGLIGERLGHSYSKVIHEALGEYSYELCEVARDELDAFFEKKDFAAINVTIPYKQTVIPHLYYIDEAARAIGAVNTVVNRCGRLYGYNTDFSGMIGLIERLGISLLGKKVAILGTGGTSHTARAVAAALLAGEIITVSRRASEGVIDYAELYEKYTDVDIIINTTPVGMYPNCYDTPIDVSKFPRLSGVIDAVYNPLRTRLVYEARRLGIKAEGGLYMLVLQAVRAAEIFLDKKLDPSFTERIFEKLSGDKENIVLIGMPACGKSTVGRIIADRLGRELIDTDDLIVRNVGRSIPEIFAESGETVFRDYESSAVKEAAAEGGRVIATGGGAILRPENVMALGLSGRLFFIDRPLEKLCPTADRPLSSDRAAIEKRYRERYPRYCEAADVHTDGDGTPNEVAERIIKEFQK